MAFSTLTTRMPNGFTNADANETFGQAGIPDPTWAFLDANDFSNYVTTDFTATIVGTGTVAATDFENGAIVLTTSTGASDSVLLQRRSAQFKLVLGKDTFFKFSGQLSHVTNCRFHCGLIATSTTPLTANDGLYLYKAEGASTLSLVSVVGGVSTTVALPTSEALVANTPFEVGFHVDVQGNVEVFFNPGTGLQTQNPSAGDSRGRVAALYAPGLTQVLLCPSFGLTNTTGVARTLTVDYYAAARNR